MKTIKLTFKGYWTEENKKNIPSESGIYCVYSCKFNASKRVGHISKLIYIGESQDVKDKVTNHERLDSWKAQLTKGENLCYSFAGITEPDRKKAEAALIYIHEPLTNIEYVNSFPFENINMQLFGKTAKLEEMFNV